MRFDEVQIEKHNDPILLSTSSVNAVFSRYVVGVTWKDFRKKREMGQILLSEFYSRFAMLLVINNGDFNDVGPFDACLKLYLSKTVFA